MNDEQQAFPDGLLNQDGMSLRDYFAARAMQGMLAGLLADGQDLKWDQVAIDSYRQANAMMKAREA